MIAADARSFIGKPRRKPFNIRFGRIRPVRIIGDACEITLRRGEIAIADAVDYERVSVWNWNMNRGGYAETRITNPTSPFGQTVIRMHRMFMCFPLVDVDHVNGDKLDNRRCNLRLATTSQNQRNKPKSKRARSKFAGVYRSNKKWRSMFFDAGRLRHLRQHETEIEAALHFDSVAIDHPDAEFIRLNFPERYR